MLRLGGRLDSRVLLVRLINRDTLGLCVAWCSVAYVRLRRSSGYVGHYRTRGEPLSNRLSGD